MTEFRMPSLGADMEEGTLLTWRVHPGDVVHNGDIVAEVDTAKAAIEVECFDDGTIGELLVPEGATVPVGTVLATIEPNGAGSGASAPVKPVAVTSPAMEADRTETVSAESGAAERPPAIEKTRARSKAKHTRRSPDKSAKTGPGHAAPLVSTSADVHATPLVRRSAQEAGIDLATIHGSGPDGRIVRADVERFIAARLDTTRAAGTKTTGTQRETTPDTGDSTTLSVGAQPVTRSDAGIVSGVVRASGYARRLARELGVDLSVVLGGGPTGAIRAADVRAAQEVAVHESAAKVPRTEEVSPYGAVRQSEPTQAASPQHGTAAMRRTIAVAMTRSKQTIPHYYLSTTIDVTDAAEWLREVNRAASVPDRIVLAALLLRGVALAARTVPAMNGHWVEDTFRPADTVDLGMIVSLRGGGIIAPPFGTCGHYADPGIDG
ncbi:E3 binding domain-containing protein [Nocardia sp. CA-084685]|uniref:E3 binding domain-containing protein n=1 Tax=Nocardia sp. CA-084685 TaxID=3239970 RepID=UPI003D994244